MKLLIDLKRELVEGKTEKLYIFTGKEHTIRSVYLNKIFELKGNPRYCESVANIYQELSKKSLIPVNYCYYCFGDSEFLKQKKEVMERLTELLQNSNSTVVLVFEDIDTTSTIYKTFPTQVTTFDFVEDVIAKKYVKKELDCNNFMANEISFHCNNDYGKILQETNKILHYTNGKTDDKDHVLDAFRYLTEEGMLFNRKIPPTPEEVSGAFIKKDRRALAEHIKLFKELELDILYYIPELYNTVNIMLMCKMYGKWDGSSKAYNAGLYWGKVKKLREIVTPYSVDDLSLILEAICKLDSDIRMGNIPRDMGFDYLIGVIL